MVRLRQCGRFCAWCLVRGPRHRPTRRAGASANPRAYPINVRSPSTPTTPKIRPTPSPPRSAHESRRWPAWSPGRHHHISQHADRRAQVPQSAGRALPRRIADQLKTDRFIWGTMTKAPGIRSASIFTSMPEASPTTAAKETYSDNLKEQNDEILRRLAQRLFDRLTGGAAAACSRSTPGRRRRPSRRWPDAHARQGRCHAWSFLRAAQLTRSPCPGSSRPRELVTISPDKETKVTVPLTPRRRGRRIRSPSRSRCERSWATARWASGAVLLVVAGIEALHYVNLQSKQNDAISNDIPREKTPARSIQASPTTPRQTRRAASTTAAFA